MKNYISLLILLVVGMLFSNKLLAQNTSSNHVDFSCFTYQQLSQGNSNNIFFSPTSVQSILNAVYAGARGETQKEIGNTLQLPNRDYEENLKLLSANTGKNKVKGVRLDVANNIWVEKSITLNPEYQLDIKMFDTEVSNVDFKNDANLARIHINKTIKEKTNNQIKELLKVGSVDGLARVILTNAVYFNGDWENQFDESLTENRSFFTTEHSSTSTKFMSKKDYYKHASNDLVQVLELPYKGNEVSMVVVLPKSKTGLENIEKQLSSKKLDEWMSQTARKEVVVFLPKFKLENNIDLRKYLQQMGVDLAFNELANFKGITKDDIHLGKIMHTTALEVSERGTEAAAATSALFMAKGASVETPTFMANHPFLFLIRNNKSGEILFMGRYANPEEEKVALNGKTSKTNFSKEKSGSKIIHIVSEGETLYQISRNYGVGADYIALSNKIEGNTIFQGQRILIDKLPKITEKSPAIAIPVTYNTSSATSSKKVNIHSVEKGETLYSISKKYQLSVEHIKKINELTENELSIGQILRLQKSVYFLIHTVKKGDTLSYISKKYNKKLNDVIKENKLKNNTIYIGQELKIEL